MNSEAARDSAALHRADFEGIAEAFAVRSASAYLCLGELRELAEPANPAAAESAGGNDAPLVLRALEGEIYARCYVRPSTPLPARRDLATHRDFINALSAANAGIGTWEPGWALVRREPDGRCVVARDGVCFWTNVERVRVVADGSPNPLCRVFVAKELRYLLSGFYYAVGNAPPGEDRDRGAPLVRLYWNLTAERALHYLARITGGLNGASIPFRTKVLSDASSYGRADSGVLYLDRRDLDRAWPTVRSTWEALRKGLGAATPMFSLRLADGLGLADDPGDGRSFGQVRCAILAQGLWKAFEDGAESAADRAKVLDQVFREHGLDPDRAHLNAGSPDYELSLGAPGRHRAGRRSR